MPLYSIPGRRAAAQLRQNRRALWPDPRRDGQRLDGLVIPAVDAGFRIRKGDAVFTVGSCFARNIELQLGKLGFRIPARDVAMPEEERASDTPNEILNKYNPHSIVNELRWAFEEPFPNEGFIQLDEDLWYDPHLGNAKPASFERVRERRRTVTDLFRQLPRCRTVVVTLGLVEAWFDTKTGFYVNNAPPAGAIAREPKRFRFDVLSYADILAELETLWALIEKHGHPRARMLITVSPVPLKATFTDGDVLVANSYSKSVLRAAVEEFAAAHRAVNYFPSYEAVMLTSRATAFLDDNRHVAPELVDAIIDRVISSYIDPGAEPAEATPVETPGQVAHLVRDHMKMGRFRHAADLLAGLEAQNGYAEAGYDEFGFRYIFGRCLVEAGRALEAEHQFRRCVELQPESPLAHYALGRALARLHRWLRAEEAFAEVVRLDPAHGDALLRLGRIQARNGKLVEAEQNARALLAGAPDNERAQALLAEIGASGAAGWSTDDSDEIEIRPRSPREMTGAEGWLARLIRWFRDPAPVEKTN